MRLIQIIFTNLPIVLLSIFTSVNFDYSSALQISSNYSQPLGYMSQSLYGPYPLTRFGVQNSTLLNTDTCFLDNVGVPIKWPNSFHTGTDWFSLDNDSAVGDPVTAIADGSVEWVSVGAVYPGETVIIKHLDPELGTLYSVYMHLDYTVKVQIGDIVNQGTQLGEVIA